MHADKTSRKISMNAVETSLARGGGASQLPGITGDGATWPATLNQAWRAGERYERTVVSDTKIFRFRLIFFLHESTESVFFKKCACFRREKESEKHFRRAREKN
jgi:hypothetical protein